MKTPGKNNIDPKTAYYLLEQIQVMAIDIKLIKNRLMEIMDLIYDSMENKK